MSRGSLSWDVLTARLPWWAGPVTTVVLLGAFTIYTLIVMFLVPASAAEYGGYLLSPLYSPHIPSPFTWLTPAIFVLWIPLGFRLTCYYYRKAYYRAFFWDPPNCSSKAQEREPRGESYRGERALWVFNNAHRYFLYAGIMILLFLWYEAIRSFFPHGGFAITLGSLIFLVNVILLSGYTFGCHSLRHLVGGRVDCYSCVRGGGARRKMHGWVSILNGRHMFWAWISLFSVWGADVYVRLLTSGVIPHDPTIIG